MSEATMDDVEQGVREIVAEALARELATVALTSNLMEDLGAGSAV